MRNTKLMALFFSALCCVEVLAAPGPDTVIVDGVAWAQPSLFIGMDGGEFVSVCDPWGQAVCNGTLNGFDVTGFRLASIEEVNELFNGVLVAVGVAQQDLLQGPDKYKELHSTWAPYFFDILGFQPTFTNSFSGTRLTFGITRSLHPDYTGQLYTAEVVDVATHWEDPGDIGTYDELETNSFVFGVGDTEINSIWLYHDSSTPTANDLLTISPPTGTYYSTQDFHLVIHVDYDMNLFTAASIMYDGTEVAGSLDSCWRQGTADSGGSTYRCPINGEDLGTGDNSLSVELEFSDGMVLTQSVTWTIEHVYE